MISPAYLFTVLFAIVAVSQAEDKSTTDSPAPSKRWLGGGGAYNAYSSSFQSSSFYSASALGMFPWISSSSSWGSSMSASSNIFGYSLFPGAYSPLLFSKDSDDKKSVSRRAISLDADSLYRRGAEESVTCVNEKGVPQQFLKSDCLKAAHKLAELHVSSATHGLCGMSLLTPHGRVAPKSIPASTFESTAQGIMKACSGGKHHHSTRANASGKNKKDDIAMVLFKA